MGTKYATQSATGYNSSPPSDDGTASEANKGKWSTIKTKLGDPVKNLADAINTALVTALAVDCTAQTATYSTVAADHLKPILCTGTFTVSLGDAVTMAVGYQVTIVNVSTGLITVGLVTGTDTLNGTANGTIVLQPRAAITVETNTSPNGYNVISSHLRPRSFLTFSGGAIELGAAGTAYWGTAHASVTEGDISFAAPFPCTIRNLRMQSSAVPGVGETYVYTLRKNSSDTALTCTTSGNSSSGSTDITHSASFTTGDVISMKIVSSSGATQALQWGIVEVEYNTTA